MRLFLGEQIPEALLDIYTFTSDFQIFSLEQGLTGEGSEGETRLRESNPPSLGKLC